MKMSASTRNCEAENYCSLSSARKRMRLSDLLQRLARRQDGFYHAADHPSHNNPKFDNISVKTTAILEMRSGHYNRHPIKGNNEFKNCQSLFWDASFPQEYPLTATDPKSSQENSGEQGDFTIKKDASSYMFLARDGDTENKFIGNIFSLNKSVNATVSKDNVCEIFSKAVSNEIHERKTKTVLETDTEIARHSKQEQSDLQAKNLLKNRTPVTVIAVENSEFNETLEYEKREGDQIKKNECENFTILAGLNMRMTGVPPLCTSSKTVSSVNRNNQFHTDFDNDATSHENCGVKIEDLAISKQFSQKCFHSANLPKNELFLKKSKVVKREKKKKQNEEISSSLKGIKIASIKMNIKSKIFPSQTKIPDGRPSFGRIQPHAENNLPENGLSSINHPLDLSKPVKTPRVCHFCGQTFFMADRLALHVKSHYHEGHKLEIISRPYKCRVCRRSFIRSDMLTRHSRLHTGAKPYTCPICEQVFSRSDHLNTHRRTHTGEKPYSCPKCSYTACRRDMITRHLRTHSFCQ